MVKFRTKPYNNKLKISKKEFLAPACKVKDGPASFTAAHEKKCYINIKLFLFIKIYIHL